MPTYVTGHLTQPAARIAAQRQRPPARQQRRSGHLVGHPELAVTPGRSKAQSHREVIFTYSRQKISP